MSLNRYLLWKDVISHPPPLTVLEARATIDLYSTTSHQWFPIVSIKRLSRELDSCDEVAAADLTALLFSMQLLSHQASEASYANYRAVKAVLTECEQNNVMSTDYCAAYVLLATYEYGQAMFPAAYLTIAHCARIFYCLGTHDKKKATQLFGILDTWTETGERRRLWWATMILDRMAHAGFRFRPLSTSHIPPDEIIPASDDEWDNVELTCNPLLVMSIEANTAVAPFARTCQAAHLLGKVCQHVNDHPNAADVDIHLEEASHICRAVAAFKVLLDHDYAASPKPHRLLTARAVCLSALHLMYDTHGCIEVDHVESAGGNRGRRLELQQLAIDGARTAAQETVDLANELEKYAIKNLPACISPLVLNCLYAAGGTWAWYHRETDNELYLQNLNVIRRALSGLQSQWHASIDYLSLLDKTEYTYMGACFQ
ncbi:hypothetical protein Slin14017_G046870 [Septoria linicola]|nr:hypothetical protein Slin14017_G046870 [Septoria linicola]